MRRKLKLVCLVMLLCASSLVGAAEPLKLAVLPTTTEFSGQADLLAAGLSTRAGVTLLERDQIQRVWREQELAAGQRPDLVKLGRLLNADGLLSLERRTAGTNELLSVRLIAVKPGVAVAEHRFALPLAQPTEWGSSYAAQIERLLPKLTVRLADAVPISLLNLRASVAGAESAALEEELTALLTFRLTRETAIFVLERRRMEELQAEKESGVADPEPFWNGAYVLDGVINRDVVSRETVTINARLAAPRGAPVDLDVSGRREALGAVVDELARKVLASLNKSATQEAWRPEAEAERFYQEAVWAWGWCLWQTSAEAADTSWCLGRRTHIVAAYRVLSRAAIGFSQRGPLDFEGVGPYGFRPPPSPAALPLLERALEIYREASRELPKATNGLAVAWRNVGLGALRASTRILDRYLDRIEFRAGHEEDLRRLRALAREINDLLSKDLCRVPVSSWRTYPEMPGFILGWKTMPIESIYDVWLDAGGVWFEKPADAIHLYFGLLEGSVYPLVRRKMLDVKLPLAAWSVKERSELSVIWLDFVWQMAASTNMQERIDGLRLILRDSHDPKELEAAAHQLVEEAWSARRQILLQELDAPVPGVLSNLVERVAAWGRPSVDQLRELQGDWSRRYVESAPDLSYVLWKEALSGLTNGPRGLTGLKALSIAPRPQQVRQLVSESESLVRKGTVSSERMKDFVDRLKISADLSDMAHESPVTNRVAAKAARPLPAATLSISRRWSIQELELPRDRDNGSKWGCGPIVRDMVWHKDRLWFGTRTYRADVQNALSRPTLLALAPGTMQVERFEAPFEQDADPYRPCCSLLVGDELYLCDYDALWRRNARGEWHRRPLPMVTGGIPYAWGEHIALSANYVLLTAERDTEQVHVLASNRRNPALNALDRAGVSVKPPLAIWPGNRLYALINRKVWTCGPNQSDWSTVFSATNCGERVELHHRGILYRQSGHCGPPVLGGLRPGSTALEFYTWEPRQATNRPPDGFDYTPPLWMTPEGYHPHDRQAAFEGSDVWLFPKPTGGGALPTNSPRSLLVLDRRYPSAIELEMDLVGVAADLAKRLDAARKKLPGFMGAFSFSEVEFLPTPAGLAILISQGGDLLWVPKTDLDRARKEALQKNPQSERQGFATFRRFDRDQNGWLDDAERRNIRRDVAWRTEQQAEWDATVKSATVRHAAEWDALFDSLDGDHDGRLSSLELVHAVSAHPEVFSDRLRGVNCPLAEAMLPFDLNADAAFDKQEFRTFLGDPRLVAEVNRSSDWVVHFGLTPEQCDKNDDGLLDRDERDEVNRLIRTRVGDGTIKRIKQARP